MPASGAGNAANTDLPTPMDRTDASRTLRRTGRVRALILSLLLLAVVSGGDLITGWSVSFVLLFLVPIAVATWYSGRRPGIIICVLATMVRLGVNLTSALPAPVMLWNTGLNFGVFLTFCILLSHLRQVRGDF